MKCTEIKCNVSECKHNEDGKACKAESVQVIKGTKTKPTDCGTYVSR